MKLWEKGYAPNASIELFTVGQDYVLDLELLPYDILGSKAHAKTLLDAGVLSKKEFQAIDSELDAILSLAQQKKFVIEISDEDCHTAIENHLTSKLGDVGKKIHTARSRNDQVLTALRLFEKGNLIEIITLVQQLMFAFKEFARTNNAVPMPGFTHTRKAMPFSIDRWIMAFYFSLEDDLKLLETALTLTDKNPLGTGAGFDVPFPLNREISTKALGFGQTISNSLYAQNSRGKIDSAILFACSSVLTSLNKWASDLILFSMPEFGYFRLHDSLTTGSSIMPHKKNPDVLELIRSSVHQVRANQDQVHSISLNLLSGYHRDIQLSKEPLMKGIQTTKDCLIVSKIVMDGLETNDDVLKAAMSEDLFSVEKVYELVSRGIPFREAYKIIAASLFKE
jgi:argininosuccinate lyase